MSLRCAAEGLCHEDRLLLRLLHMEIRLTAGCAGGIEAGFPLKRQKNYRGMADGVCIYVYMYTYIHVRTYMHACMYT